MLYLRTKDRLKRYRVSLSIKKCENLIEKRVEFKEFLRDFSGLLKWRIFLSEELPELSHRVYLAFSGGIDSGASLLIMREIGAEITPLVVVNRSVDLDWTKNFLSEIGLKGKFLNTPDLHFRGHPCGPCSRSVRNAIYSFLLERGEDCVVVFGDCLPTGSLSITSEEFGIKIALPASLSLDKNECIALMGREVGEYGCLLLRKTWRDRKDLRKYTLSRIMRELRNRSIDPKTALKYIKSLEKKRFWEGTFDS